VLIRSQAFADRRQSESGGFGLWQRLDRIAAHGTCQPHDSDDISQAIPTPSFEQPRQEYQCAHP
jgi:hypothetical protein